MLTIRKAAFARAGLVGNPSDGYGGKTISLVVKPFRAEAVLSEADQVELVPSTQDRVQFDSVLELTREVERHGYYGGLRLAKATITRFANYCGQQHHDLHDRNFSIRYESNIPRQVGLAGSSAIIVAVLRCLMEFYDVAIPLEVQPSLALSVETDELGLAAGLQDRVIQVYEGLVYMDFAPEQQREMHGLRCYQYERLDPSLLPPLYLAFKADVSKPVQQFSNNLRERFQAGDPVVLAAMRRFAELTVAAKNALLRRDTDTLARLMNENFDLRRSIYQLPREQIELVETARAVGASAKFAGSGGAIVGTLRDEAMWERLKAALAGIGCEVVRLN